MDLVEHFSRLLDERDIELGYLQKSVGPKPSDNDELGSNYYEESNPETPSKRSHWLPTVFPLTKHTKEAKLISMKMNSYKRYQVLQI